MKLELAILSLLCICIHISCNQRVDILYENSFIIEEANEAILTTGKEYNFVVSLDSVTYQAETGKIKYAEVFYTFSNLDPDSSFVIKLIENSINIFTGKFQVPDRVATVNILIGNKNNYFFSFPTVMFPVKDVNNKFVIGSELALLRQTDSKEQFYLNYSLITKDNPDYHFPLIYKWLFEKSKGRVSSTEIRNDIKKIQNENSNDLYLPSLKYTGYLMIGDTIGAETALNEILSKKNNPILNSFLVFVLSQGILDKQNPEKSDVARINSIVSNNPYSMFTQTIISGFSKLVNKDTLLNCLHSINSSKSTLSLILREGSLCAQKFPDSIKRLTIIVHKLDSLCNLPYYEYGFDSGHKFEIRKQDYYISKSMMYRKNNDYVNALSILDSASTHLGGADSRQAIIQLERAYIYIKIGSLDSALECCYRSEKYSPNYATAIKLKSELLAQIQSSSYRHFNIDSMEKNTTLPRIGLPESLPVMLLDDNSIIDLIKKKNKVIILELLSKNCSPCIENIKILNKLKKENSDIEVYILSNENIKGIQGMLENMGLRLPCVVNSHELIYKLGLSDTYTGTLIINKQGQIVKKHFGTLTEKDVTTNL